MRVRSILMLLVCLTLAACKEPYRIGEYVWVEWEKGKLYPAYIIEKKSKTRYRVHYDGYDTRWDEDVTLDRIQGRVTGTVRRLPPPERVLRVIGQKPVDAEETAQAASPYKVGDRVKVRWRGSIYSATIVGVVDRDKYLVHYDGHESAWDEVVHRDRIEKKK